MFSANDVKIPAERNALNTTVSLKLDTIVMVQLWFVRGIDDGVYPVKLAAEEAARLAFGPDSYGRVSYKSFIADAPPALAAKQDSSRHAV
jgi:hypothetical protein